MDFIFDNESPRLRLSAQELLCKAKGLARSDQILIRLALDLWCDEPFVGVSELFELDPEPLRQVLAALSGFCPSPGPDLSALFDQ
jgi:hypothetical protein